MYQLALEVLRSKNPLLKVIGLTATPYRSKSGRLTDGKLFDTIVCDETTPEAFRRFIADGYLSPLVPKAARTEIDLSTVRTVAGDYNRGQLEEVMIDKTDAAISEIIAQGGNRRRWLIFCAGIAHSEKVNRSLIASGIDSRVVHSKQTTEERDAAIYDFRAGRCRAIVNTGILTTGFNCPEVDLVAVLRPTQSPGLWVQMLGRGTRPAPGKTDCMVLDFGRNTERLGPIDAVRLPRGPRERRGEPQEPAAKICISCFGWIHPAARICPQCGYEFPPGEVEITEQASTRALMSVPVEPKWYTVDHVAYSVHRGKSGRESLRAMYHCGLKMYSEYICIGYPGYPGQKAARWLAARTHEIPATPAEAAALSHDFCVPEKILIKPVGKFFEITNYQWRHHEDSMQPGDRESY